MAASAGTMAAADRADSAGAEGAAAMGAAWSQRTTGQLARTEPQCIPDFEPCSDGDTCCNPESVCGKGICLTLG